MSDMPALHIRNVPVDVIETLRRRGKLHGRSLNAEALRVLAESAAREGRETPITKRLEAIARRVNLPPDAPRPEELIRQDRDSR
jgi:plasmid stability protein